MLISWGSHLPSLGDLISSLGKLSLIMKALVVTSIHPLESSISVEALNPGMHLRRMTCLDQLSHHNSRQVSSHQICHAEKTPNNMLSFLPRLRQQMVCVRNF